MSVATSQRHKRARPCGVCGGGDDDRRGHERRCHGWTTDDGEWVHCSREDLAGAIEADPNGQTFAHRMHGPCRCGVQHGEARSDARAKREIVATYDYTDESGTMLFQVVRYAPKDFRQRKPDGTGGWLWQIGNVRRVPYRLPDLLAADPSRPVYVVEGEKDVDAMWAAGHPATCNAGGAGKWGLVAAEASKVLAGREVIVVADADPPGRKHAQEVAESLGDSAASVRVLEPPRPYKDVSALFSDGKTIGALVTLSDAEPDGEEKPERYKIWTPEEIYAPIPPATYTIDPLLRRGNLALIVAFGSSLKTWKMITAATAIATGERFLERFDCPNPGPILIVDWESGSEELRRRLQADAKARGLSGPVRGVEFITMPDLFFTSKDFEPELTKLAEGRAAVLFDSLAAGSVEVEENDARFAQGLQVCRRVGEKTGASMLALHHSRKDGGEDSDERQSVRGTGAIFAAADVVFSLRRPRKAKDNEDAFVVRQTKARGGKRVAPFVIRVQDQPDGGVRTYATDLEEDGDDIAEETRAAASSFGRVRRSIVMLLGEERELKSANAINVRVKGSKPTVLAALRELQEERLVVQHDGCFRLASEVTQ